MEIIIALVVLIIISIFTLQALSKYKDVYGYYIRKGNIYFDEHKYEKALECYEYAIELDPKRPEAYIYLEDSYPVLKKQNLSIELCEKCISADSNNICGYVLRMYTNYDLKAFNKVIKDAEKILSLAEANNKALEYTAKSYFSMRDYENAAKYYLKLIENEDKFIAKNNYYACICLALSKKAEDAVTLAQKCIEKSPKELYGYEALMIAYYKLQKYDQVIETAEEILIMKPHYEKACNVFILLAMINVHDNNFDECYKNLEEAVKRNHGQLENELLDNKIFDSIRDEEKFKKLCSKISNEGEDIK